MDEQIDAPNGQDDEYDEDDELDLFIPLSGVNSLNRVFVHRKVDHFDHRKVDHPKLVYFRGFVSRPALSRNR